MNCSLNVTTGKMELGTQIDMQGNEAGDTALLGLKFLKPLRLIRLVRLMRMLNIATLLGVLLMCC